jgi:hypothetical protein
LQRQRWTTRASAANVVRLREFGFDFDFMLWLETDARWPPGTIERMMQMLAARPDLDIRTAFSGERLPLSGASAFPAGVQHDSNK